jgi:hypothetical protein
MTHAYVGKYEGKDSYAHVPETLTYGKEVTLFAPRQRKRLTNKYARCLKRTFPYGQEFTNLINDKHS